MPLNHFLHVPSLRAYAYSIAEEIAQGGNVVAVTGPHARNELVEAVSAHLSLAPTTKFPDSIDDALACASSAQLVVCQNFSGGDSREWLGGQVRGFHGRLKCAPITLPRRDLLHYSTTVVATTPNCEKSLGSVLAEMAVELSCGDLRLLDAIVEYVIKEYNDRSSMFPDPLHCITQHAARAQRDHPVEADELRHALLQLAETSKGVSASELKHDVWLRAWEKGLATGVDSTMRAGWAVLIDEDGRLAFPKGRLAGSASLSVFENIAIARVAAGYRPLLHLLEQFRIGAISTLLDACSEMQHDLDYTACLNGQIERRTLGRGTDLLGLGYYVEQNTPAWSACGLMGTVDMQRIRCFRNNILHLRSELSPSAEGTIDPPTRRSLRIICDVLDQQGSPFDPTFASWLS